LSLSRSNFPANMQPKIALPFSKYLAIGQFLNQFKEFHFFLHYVIEIRFNVTLPKRLFPSGHSTKMFNEFLTYNIRATYLTHLILVDLIMVTYTDHGLLVAKYRKSNNL
jgi:hypothetical protein